MKSFGLLLTSLIICCIVSGQTTEDSVKAAVNKLFTGMKTSNGAMIKSSFGDSAILQTLNLPKKEIVKEAAKEINIS